MPEETAPPPAPAGMQVQMHMTEERGPDGKVWCKTEVRVGLTAYAFIVPPDMAEQFAEILPEKWTESATRARLANGGIVVAQNGHIPARLEVAGG